MEKDPNSATTVIALAKLLASTLDLQEILTRMMDEVARSLSAERGALYLVDQEKRMIWSVVALGDETLSLRLPFGHGIAGHVAETGWGVLVNDARQDPRFDAVFDRCTGFTTRQVLCLPVTDTQGRLLAVVQLLNKAEGEFTSEDMQLLSQLTDFLALAVANASIYAQIQQQKRRLERFYDISRLIVSGQPLDEVLRRIVEISVEVADAEAGSILLFDKRRRHLHFYSVVGRAEPVVKTLRLKRGQGIAWSVAECGRGEIIDDVQSDERFYPEVDRLTGFVTRGMICVPLCLHGDVLGVMEVLNKRQGRFADQELEEVQAVADLAAAAISTAELRGEIVRVRRHAEQGLAGRIEGLMERMR